MYLLSCVGDEGVLFCDTVINVREDEEGRIMILSGDESLVAEFTHKALDGFHITFTLLDTTRNVLEVE